ncbi:MAG: hypothetical protein ACXV5F_02835, partial [Halobacteriota archaeon]
SLLFVLTRIIRNRYAGVPDYVCGPNAHSRSMNSIWFANRAYPTSGLGGPNLRHQYTEERA